MTTQRLSYLYWAEDMPDLTQEQQDRAAKQFEKAEQDWLMLAEAYAYEDAYNPVEAGHILLSRRNK